MEEEFHAKMRDLKREMSLTPVLLAILYFISFVHKIYEDMPCMYRILHIGDQEPMEKGIRQQIHDQEDGE